MLVEALVARMDTDTAPVSILYFNSPARARGGGVPVPPLGAQQKNPKKLEQRLERRGVRSVRARGLYLMDRMPLNIYDTEVRRHRRGLGYAKP